MAMVGFGYFETGPLALDRSTDTKCALAGASGDGGVRAFCSCVSFPASGGGWEGQEQPVRKI